MSKSPGRNASTIVICSPRVYSDMLSNIAAILFALLSAVTVGFQLALACGAPWGELTLGGKYRGQLPRHIRLIPLLTSVLLIGFASIVAARAGLAFANISAASHAWIWVVVGYCVLGAIANAITPSLRERAAWLPVLIVMLVSSTIVGIG